MDKIAILGLGYVGLPLSLRFVAQGRKVIGLDLDPAKITALKASQSYINHIPADAIAGAMRSGLLEPSTDMSRVSEAEAIIVCVPTPLTKRREPDLSHVLNTGRAIAPHFQRGALVVLESTTYPGTTDEDLRAVLEEGSDMKAGRDFHLAFRQSVKIRATQTATLQGFRRWSVDLRQHVCRRP